MSKNSVQVFCFRSHFLSNLKHLMVIRYDNKYILNAAGTIKDKTMKITSIILLGLFINIKPL